MTDNVFGKIAKPKRCHGFKFTLDFANGGGLKILDCMSRETVPVKCCPKDKIETVLVKHNVYAKNDKGEILLDSNGKMITQVVESEEKKLLKSYNGILKNLCKDCIAFHSDMYNVHVIDRNFR